MPTTEFTPAQLLAAIKSSIVSFGDFMTELRGDVADERLHAHIDRMLLQIYVHWREGRYISKMQACRMVPAEHMDTCKKYVARAEQLQLVNFVPDAQDGRRMNVVPTPAMVDYIEDRARQSLTLAQGILTQTH